MLAQRLRAPLLLVHTHRHDPRSRTLEQTEYEQMVRSFFDSTFFQVQALMEGEREREMRVIASDSPAAGLQRIAEHEQAQLIVVGPSHRSGLGRVRPGSVGERLLSGAPVPVAIATRGYADQEPRLEHLTAGFDGPPESSQALHWAVNLAGAGDGRVRLISVHTPIALGYISAGGAFAGESVNQALRRDLTQQHTAAIAAHGERVDGALRNGDAATVLIDASRSSDMLVLGSRGYGPLRAVLLGSVSQAVIRHATCPVVVVPRSATHEPRNTRVRGVDGDGHPLAPLEPLKLDDRCLRVLRDRA
jgi:nucleotide-binding universal stress UspA family protein